MVSSQPLRSHNSTHGQAGPRKQHGVFHRQRCRYHRRGIARQDRATADVEASMRRFMCQVGLVLTLDLSRRNSYRSSNPLDFGGQYAAKTKERFGHAPLKAALAAGLSGDARSRVRTAMQGAVLYTRAAWCCPKCAACADILRWFTYRTPFLIMFFFAHQ